MENMKENSMLYLVFMGTGRRDGKSGMMMIIDDIKRQ